MRGGDQEWSDEIEALGDAIAALTARQAAQLALYLHVKLSGEERGATPQSSVQHIGSYDIALGLTDHLAAFRNAIAPEAAIYTEWHQLGLTSESQFVLGFHEVARGANAIHFNIQGIHSIADAVQFGARGFHRIPAGFSSKYTNYELFILSFWAKYGNGTQSAEQIRSRIRWFNGTNRVEQPAEWFAMWPDG